MRRFFVLTLIVSGSVALACGSSDNGNNNGNSGNDAGTGSDTGTVTTHDAGNGGGNDGSTGGGNDGGVNTGDAAPPVSIFPTGKHAALPQLLDQGGPVLTAPQVVTVTFPNDKNQARFEAFGASATSTAWWATTTSSYCETGSTTKCVGPGTGTASHQSAAPKTTYNDSQDSSGPSDIRDFINTSITSKALPAPDANGQSIYVLYFPSTTTINQTDKSGNVMGTSCQQFAGYHGSGTSGTTQYTYAVIPDCLQPDGGTGTNLSEGDTMMFAASHELAEAATDPYAVYDTSGMLKSLGYYLDFSDNSTLPWNAAGGGESADMCVDSLLGTQDQTSYSADAGTFTVQRIWNNANAAASKDPCVPTTGSTPYFNVAPQQWITEMAVGSSVSFYADAFEDGTSVSSWTFEGIDFNASATTPNEYTTITVNGAKKTTVKPGDRVTVTVTLNKDPGALTAQQGGALVGLVSFTGSGTNITAAHFWPLLATSKVDAVDAGLDTVDAANTSDLQKKAYLRIAHQLPGRLKGAL